tara:strand:+ start:48238 stop:48864 length:627 start_codon:yes stop_codon:yes gene_type:complete
MNFDEIEEDFSDLEMRISEIGKEFRERLEKMQPKESSLQYWDQLVKDWADDKSLPLYIRKFNENYSRGKEVIHNSGRIIIPCDNGVAHWGFSMCFNSIEPSLQEIKRLVDSDRVPIAMVLKKKEREQAKYFRTKHDIDDPNKKGWKVSHKVPIGLKSKDPLEEIDIELLKSHFRKFVNPNNMFLFPKKYSGLAEIEEIIDSFKSRSAA